jgi:hypothetical protein
VTSDAPRTLDDTAEEFATKLTTLTRGVLGPGSPRFHAVNLGSRIRVAPIDEREVVQPIPVAVNAEHRLDLSVIYFCCWDGPSMFMAIDRADFKIYYRNGNEPLLRYEYERGSTEIPGAHIQVHAHRDETAFLLRLAEAGRPRDKLNRDRIPRLAEMHLPVGGHRMRPSLEDVLLLLQREFAIDTADGWRKVLDEHLREWRTLQVKTAVRDAPEDAANVLRALGYEVVPPAAGIPRQAANSKLFLP